MNYIFCFSSPFMLLLNFMQHKYVYLLFFWSAPSFLTQHNIFKIDTMLIFFSRPAWPVLISSLCSSLHLLRVGISHVPFLNLLFFFICIQASTVLKCIQLPSGYFCTFLTIKILKETYFSFPQNNTTFLFVFFF